MPKNYLATLAAPLAGYDWNNAATIPSLNDTQQKALQQLVDASRDGTVEYNAGDVSTASKAGFYIMHQQKNTDDAATVLGVVHGYLQAQPEQKKALIATGGYYDIPNNLAYILANSSHPEAPVHALNYLQETLDAKSSDVALNSFAKRILGQTHFAQANHQPDIAKRVKLVKHGVEICKAGIIDLDPKEHRPDIARTHNRNAVELYKVAMAVENPKMKRMLLGDASASAETALNLWKTTPEKEFPEYKGRTRETLGDIAIATHALTGQAIQRTKALNHFRHAAEHFTLSGNDKGVETCEGKLAAIAKRSAQPPLR